MRGAVVPKQGEGHAHMYARESVCQSGGVDVCEAVPVYVPSVSVCLSDQEGTEP